MLDPDLKNRLHSERQTLGTTIILKILKVVAVFLKNNIDNIWGNDMHIKLPNRKKY